MTGLYNIYKKLPGHRNKYRKIYSTDSWEMLNKKIDEELFIHCVQPDDIIVRRAGFEPDYIGENLYGYD